MITSIRSGIRIISIRVLDKRKADLLACLSYIIGSLSNKLACFVFDRLLHTVSLKLLNDDLDVQHFALVALKSDAFRILECPVARVGSGQVGSLEIDRDINFLSWLNGGS